VAEAFIGPCPPGLVVNHRDGNRQNNCVQNLEYCTYSENALHAVASGVWPVGERHCCAKLTARDVEEIRDLCASGVMYQRDIGTAYGITQSNVSRIGRRIGWAHAA
jgi:hypothetical protein